MNPSPPKPWETGSTQPVTSNPVTTTSAPELPTRPRPTMSGYGYNSGYNSGYGYGNTMGYGTGYTGGYGNYGGYSGYGGGMYNRYGNGMYGGMYGGYNRRPMEDSLTQRMEQSTASTFQTLDSIVQAFMGFSHMLESTFFATQSSFMAMVGVAEQFGQLKSYLGQVFSIVSLYQSIKGLGYRLTGKPNPNVSAGPRPSKKPLFFFLALIVGLPYLMSKLIKRLESQKQIDIKNIDFCKAVFDFQSDQPGDLTFRKGDLVAILGKEGDWWRGRTQDGRIGMFPQNYVKLIPKVDSQPGIQPTPTPAIPSGEFSVADFQ